MNRELVLKIIGANESDDIDDVWEQYLFSFKQKVLQTPLNLLLINARTKLASKMCGYYQTLYNEAKIVQVQQLQLDLTTIDSAFWSVENSISNLKLKISNSNNIFEVHHTINQLENVLIKYYDFLLNLGEKLSIDATIEGDPQDPYVVKEELFNVYPELKTKSVDGIDSNLPSTDKQFPIFAAELARLIHQTKKIEKQ